MLMSAQIFAYVIDVPSLYALAKAWPILAAPFALVVLFRRRVRNGSTRAGDRLGRAGPRQ